MIVQRIGILSLAKVTGAIYGALGIIVGIMFGLFMFFGGLMSSAAGGPEAIAGMVGGIVGGIAFAVMMPLMYGVMGFVGGLITAGMYNLFAQRFGGVELEVTER